MLRKILGFFSIKDSGNKIKVTVQIFKKLRQDKKKRIICVSLSQTGCKKLFE